MSTPNLVTQYVAEIRRIYDTGSATAETSFYPPIEHLFNAVGDKLSRVFSSRPN